MSDLVTHTTFRVIPATEWAETAARNSFKAKNGDRIDSYFNFNFEREWLDHPLVRKMIKDVDRSEVIAGSVIDSPVLGLISPRELSGGVKALILMLFEPENEYYATACGDNCGKWMIEIGKMHDVTICLTRILRFRPPEEAKVKGMNAFCLNNNKPVDTMIDLIDAYTDFVRSEEVQSSRLEIMW